MDEEFVNYQVFEPNREEPLIQIAPVNSFVDLYTQDLAKARKTIAEFRGEKRKIVTDMTVVQLYERWVERLGFKEKQIREHLDWKDTQIRDVKTSWSIREILEGSDYIEELVPSLIPLSALLIFFASGKTGKTSALIDLIFGITVSGQWLGLPCKRGKVIQYDLEQSRSTYKRKVVKRGFSDPEANHLRFNDIIRVEKKFNILEDLDKLREYIYEFKPVLVTFDSFRKILAPTGISENSAEAGGLLYMLQDICIETGVNICVIHHSNKSGKGVEAISGSGSLIGASDGLFKFDKFTNDQGQTRVKLQTYPRDGIERTLVIKMNHRLGGRWDLCIEKELNVDPEVEHLQGKIIRLLSTKPHNKYSEQSIKSSLRVDRSVEEHFQQAMTNLQELSIIYSEKIDHENFIYFIHEESPFFDDTNYLSKYITQEAILADELVRCNGRQEVRLLTADWDTTLKSKVFALLSEKEQQLVKDLLTNCPYSIGQDVVYNGLVLSVQESKIENKTYWFRLSDYEDWVSEDDLGLYVEEPVVEVVDELDPQSADSF